MAVARPSAATSTVPLAEPLPMRPDQEAVTLRPLIVPLPRSAISGTSQVNWSPFWDIR